MDTARRRLVADLARGAGYAWTMWPLVLRFAGAPIGWLLWLLLPGIGLLMLGYLWEWLGGHEPVFRLNTRQAGAFVAATLVFWLLFGLAVGFIGEPGGDACSGPGC